MERIESLTNQRVKNWVKLHDKKERDKTGRFLIEGEHLIQEALKAGIVEFIITDREDRWSFEKTIYVTDGIMKKMSTNISAVHEIAVCRQMNLVPSSFHRILVLDGVQDPGNLGTLIRTAISFSFDAVYCSEKCCDLYNEKTIRSTQGAMFHIPVIRTNLIYLCEELQKKQVRVIATTLEQAKPISEIPSTENMAFILGNEGQGVCSELQNAADERLRIEMNGFESLNVAVAGGIIMYEYRK